MKTTEEGLEHLRQAAKYGNVGGPAVEALIDALAEALSREKRVQDLMLWALRSKWYLDSNCAGHDSADRLREEIDELLSDPYLSALAEKAD